VKDNEHRQPTREQIGKFLRNLDEAQKQPREWWCVICGARWTGTRRDGPPCDCWKEQVDRDG
jgi:hypothetical protein